MTDESPERPHALTARSWWCEVLPGSYNTRMLDFGTTAFISILFLVDPPGTIPAFMALTAKYSPEKRRKTAFVASLTATLTLAVFAAIGNFIFNILGLTLPAFQIAGGIILFLVALDMIRAAFDAGRPRRHEGKRRRGRCRHRALAIPMLAGPAALSTVAVLMAQARTDQVPLVFLSIALTGLICFLCLRLAEPIQKRLGKTGIHILGRVLGLVLAGIAVQFILNGLHAAGLIPKPKG